MTTTWNNDFVMPRVNNALMLMTAGVLCLAALRATPKPFAAPVSNVEVLRVEVSPRQAFGPVRLTVTTHQAVQAVAGREVCLHIQGAGAVLSCWQMDAPTPVVIRTFTLVDEGTYEIYAQVGTVHSNHTTATVVQ